jgi:hypothetical protein
MSALKFLAQLNNVCADPLPSLQDSQIDEFRIGAKTSKDQISQEYKQTI